MRPAAPSPASRRSLIVWGGFALTLILLPQIFRSGAALTLLTQMATLVIVCLSYNLLLGQGGMLSFGHAVYVGLGSFFAIHALNLAGSGSVPVPVSLIPLVGGAAGLFFAALLGYVTTKKAATPFAMITLGVGELVFAMALMFPEFFGGEAGISSNRVIGTPVLGVTFGPPIQVYYLIAAYCFICTAALYALTRTPLGRILNAVRDNPQRVEFVGYDTRRVRYLAFMISGFFAGIAGGLAAINFETITAEVVRGDRSGAYLLFTFLGGAGFFFGPIIGAVLFVFALFLLSEVTKAWLIYLGLGFMLMVMFAPGGVASLIMMNLRVASHGKLGRLFVPYLALFGACAVLLVGGAAIVEMVYHIQLDAALGSEIKFMGGTLDTQGRGSWAAALAGTAVGVALFETARRRFARHWSTLQGEIEAELRQREASA